MAIKVVAQVLWRLRFTRVVTKLTAQKKLVDMTPTWYTTFQVIKGPLGGGKRRNGGGRRRSGGGKGAHVFQEEQKVISRRRKDVWGGGATVSNWLQINCQ